MKVKGMKPDPIYYESKRDVDIAVAESLTHLAQVESRGGPRSFGEACRFVQCREFVVAMGSSSSLSNYAYDFTLKIR